MQEPLVRREPGWAGDKDFSVDEMITEIVEKGGYWGIAFMMALENIIPPIPSELIMGLGGVLLAQGVMSFWPLLLAGTIGATAGNYFWFWIGYKFGYQRMKPFIDRWGRWLTVDWDHVEQACDFFRRHGHWVVFFVRFSPILRTIISLPAGMTRMPVMKFLVFTFVGSGIWNALLILGGQFLGQYIEEYEGVMTWIVLGGVALTLLGYLYRVVTWKPREQREAEAGK